MGLTSDRKANNETHPAVELELRSAGAVAGDESATAFLQVIGDDMVGGIVIEASESKSRPELIFIDCKESQSSKTLGIYVEKNADSLQIEIGDSVWWQGRLAMWTPKRNSSDCKEADQVICGVDYDIQIPRISYSGVEHPDRKEKVTSHE